MMTDRQMGHSQAISLNPRDVQSLREQLRGRLIGPLDEGYEDARRVWNRAIDRHPALVAQPVDADDIAAGVRFAREHDLLLALRGGGHGIAGYGTCDGGLVLDLSAMKGIEVDPSRRMARVQPGVRLGELDRATQAYALAVPSGTNSDTGIAGLTLGGGLGWLARLYGLTCDNLLYMDVVTAEGKKLTVSATENEDLFWAMRGAGANFGVVSSFQYRLHPVGPIVLAGMIIHPASQARELLRFYDDFARTMPPELSAAVGVLTLPPDPTLPPEHRGQKAVALLCCYCGNLQAGEEAIKPLRAFGAPLIQRVGPMPYLVWQSILDAGSPIGAQHYLKSAYIKDLSTPLVDIFVAQTEDMSGPMAQIQITYIGGAVQSVPEGAMAFSHRDAGYLVFTPTSWFNPADAERNIAWTRQLHTAMEPYTAGVYVNFLGDEGERRIISAYGPDKYERLVELKTRYDPTNLFRRNQNIKPRAL